MASTIFDIKRQALSAYAERDNNTLLQQFGLREDVIAALSAIGRFRMFDEGVIRQLERLIELPTAPAQTLNIQGIYKKPTVTQKTGRSQTGAGVAEVTSMVPNYQTRLRGEFNYDWVTYAQQQGFSVDTGTSDSELRRLQADHYLFQFMEFVVVPLYKQLNAQLMAYLAANKWALTTFADKSTFYTTNTGDQKNIPTADAPSGTTQQFPVWAGRLQADLMKNNFTQFGNPLILHSTRTLDVLREYERRGAGNIVNLVREIQGMNFVHEVTLADSGADLATFYTITNNSIQLFFRDAFPYNSQPGNVNGVVDGANGKMIYRPTVIGAGTAIMPNMPRLVLEHNGTANVMTDTSATQGSPGVLNTLSTEVFTVQMGIEHARDYANAAIAPWMKYRIGA